MNLIQKLAIGTAVLASVATMGVTATQAARAPSDQNHMSSLVAAIAQKFNLSQSDVQQIFDQQRTQQQTQMQAKHAEALKTRLDQAVKNAKLTQAQADAIIAKHAELKIFMDGLKNKTEAERKAAMKTQKEALVVWAKANAIPDAFAQIFHGGPGGKGMAHGPRGGNAGGRFGQGGPRMK